MSSTTVPGRFTFFANYQVVTGEEFRAFDPTQGNYILGGRLSLPRSRGSRSPRVFYHQSRHLSDRPKRQAVDWNMFGGRVEPVVLRGAGGTGHASGHSRRRRAFLRGLRVGSRWRGSCTLPAAPAHIALVGRRRPAMPGRRREPEPGHADRGARRGRREIRRRGRCHRIVRRRGASHRSRIRWSSARRPG